MLHMDIYKQLAQVGLMEVVCSMGKQHSDWVEIKLQNWDRYQLNLQSYQDLLQFFLFYQNMSRMLGPCQTQIRSEHLQYSFPMSSSRQPAKLSSQSPPASMHPELNLLWPYFINSSLILLSVYLCYVVHLPLVYIFLTYGVMPMLDQLLSHDWVNPTISDMEYLDTQWKFKIPLYVNIVVEWVAYFLSIKYLLEKPLYTQPVEIFILVGLSTTGFLITHELFHKNSLVDKIIGTIHQIKYLYMHFTVEHIYGHHKRVATPEDPASAPKGMTLNEFIPRSIVGSFKSALEINPRFVMATIVADVVFLGFMFKIFGARGVFLAILLAAGSVTELETINYVEHYGLERKKLPDGTYEKVNIRHSWNAPHKFSNFLLLKIQRHSDHHENALKPYQSLNSEEDSPQLPHGYIVCLYAAMFPKVWFDIMDPLVDQYKNSTKGRFMKTLAISEAKTVVFVKYAFAITLSLMCLQIFYRLAV